MSGPEGKSFYQIQIEQGLLDGSIRRLGRFAAETPEVLPAGTYPKIKHGPWSTNDRLGVEPPTGEKVDGDDPTGVLP